MDKNFENIYKQPLRGEVTNKHLFNVILGPRPANLKDHRISSGDDRCWGRLPNTCCNLFKYPSPDTIVSPSPSRGEGLKHVLRPQCAPDATGFLSVILHILCHCRTRSGNLDQRVKPGDDTKVEQCGRSMIEMLGVLAIIGVLSIGGIAGYSKAMFMWRSNIQRNLIAGLLHGAIDLKLRLNHQNIPFQNITSVLAGLGNIPEGVEYKNEKIYTKEGFDVHLSYGLRTLTSIADGHTYQKNQYTIYFLFNQGGTALNLSEEDFCNNLLQVSKEVANEVSDITFWKTDSTSTSPNGDTGIVLYTGKSLKNASITEMRLKCKMVFTETGFAHFNITLKYD